MKDSVSETTVRGYWDPCALAEQLWRRIAHKEKPAHFIAGKKQSEDTTRDQENLKAVLLWSPSSNWTVSPKAPTISE